MSNTYPVIDGDPLITTVLSSDSNSSATGAEVGSRASIPPTSAAAAKSANEASETEVVDGNQSRLQADSSLPSDCVPVRANVVCDVDSSEPQLGGGSTRANATPRYGPGEFVPVPKSMYVSRDTEVPRLHLYHHPDVVGQLHAGLQALRGPSWHLQTLSCRRGHRPPSQMLHNCRHRAPVPARLRHPLRRPSDRRRTTHQPKHRPSLSLVLSIRSS